MKAELLGWINPKLAGIPAKKLLEIERRSWLGDVEPLDLETPSDCYQALLKHALQHDLKPSPVPHYNDKCILPLAGSVGWHHDDGMGLLLSWLIHESQLSRKEHASDKQLIYPGGAIDVRVGDVFLFNANKGHAWYSNSRCTLAQMTVTKTRSRKT